jgi:hypothetical protein
MINGTYAVVNIKMGNLERGGSSNGDFEKWLKRGSREGGPCVINGRLWRRPSVFVEAQFRKLEWPHLLGTLGDG